MKVELPDGKIAEFPDDMPHEQIADVIKQTYLSPQREISSITGKAIPTAEEAIAPGHTILRQVLPAAGDLALSYLLKRPITGLSTVARAAIPALPMAGKMFGGAVGAVSRAGVAGVGSGAGEVAAQGAFGENFNMDAVKNQMTFGAATSLGFDTLSKTLGTTFKYLKNHTAGGSGATKVIVENIREKMTQRAEKFVNDLAPAGVEKQANALDDVSVKLRQAELEAGAEYDVYEKAVQNHYKNVGEIDLQNTFNYLDNLRNEVADRQATGQVIKEDAMAKSGQIVSAPKQGMSSGSRVRKDIALRQHFGWSATSKQARVLDEIFAAQRTGEPVSADSVLDLTAMIFKKGKGSAWENLTRTQQKSLEGLKSAIKEDLNYIPVEQGASFIGPPATAKTAKVAADENYKAIKKFSTIEMIFNKSITRDDLGKPVLKPYLFAKNILLNEKKFTSDPILNEIWPQLKAEAEYFAVMSKELSGDAFRAGQAGWVNNIPVTSFFGKISAYAMLDPASQKIISKIIKYGGSTVGQPALKLGTKVIGQEAGFTDNQPPEQLTPSMTQ